MKTLKEIETLALREKRLALSFKETSSQYILPSALFFFGAALLALNAIVYWPEFILSDTDAFFASICFSLAALSFAITRTILRKGLQFTEIPVNLTQESFAFIIKELTAYYELRVINMSGNVVVLATDGSLRALHGERITIVRSDNTILINSIHQRGYRSMPVPIFGNNRHNIKRIREEIEDFAQGKSPFGNPIR